MPLFRSGRGGSTPTSALHLRFRSCPLERACELNAIWHSRLPVARPGNMQVFPSVAYIAEHDDIAYAVGIWSRPIARMLNDKHWIELRRFAIAPDAPKNTASRMLGWMTRDVERRFPRLRKAISYQDTEVHRGTIYKACGWIATVRSRVSSRGWETRAYRNTMQTTAYKVLWERDLNMSNAKAETSERSE